ncbi:MAG: type 1 glutamine amidotransferase, partial [Agromyces sp.]
MTLNIVALLPGLFNTNGDAENARVLESRARWAGLDPQLHWIDDVTQLPERVDLVVFGSGADSDLAAGRSALLPIIDRVRAWPTERTVLLAIGSGWELLSWGVERDGGEIVEGLGVFAGRSVPAPNRIVGDLVVDSPWGQLVGFENHARDYVGAEKSSLGTVRCGSGNGIPQPSGRRHEGIVMGTAIGTHLHGPVCAKNPEFADALLELA